MSQFNRSQPQEDAAFVGHAAALTDRRFLSVEEFCQQTGLSPATVWRRLKDGSLPSYQPGGKGTRVLIPLEALTAVPPAPATTTSPPRRPSRPRPLAGPVPRWQSGPSRPARAIEDIHA